MAGKRWKYGSAAEAAAGNELSKAKSRWKIKLERVRARRRAVMQEGFRLGLAHMMTDEELKLVEGVL